MRESSNLVRWVRISLLAQIALACVFLVSGYYEQEFYESVQNGEYYSEEQLYEDADALDQRNRLIGISYFVVFVISGFLILRWIHRVNYNARQLGADGMRFTPGWAIAFYFIPILMLWKPYQAMKEIWKASKDPKNWKAEESSNLLPLWWFLYLLTGFLGQLIFRMPGESLEELQSLNLITQISNAVDVVLAVVLLVIVNRINDMQVTQAERIADRNRFNYAGSDSRDGFSGGANQRKSVTDSSMNNKTILCLECSQKIRVAIPLAGDVIKCPTCTTRMQIFLEDNGEISLSKLGSGRKDTPDYSDSSVRSSFEALGLSMGASSREVRVAYKKRMSEYHPDKVANMGDKLKALADEETKKINAAYALLKEAGYA